MRTGGTTPSFTQKGAVDVAIGSRSASQLIRTRLHFDCYHIAASDVTNFACPIGYATGYAPATSDVPSQPDHLVLGGRRPRLEGGGGGRAIQRGSARSIDFPIGDFA